MDGAIQSFLSGIPFLLTHFGVTIVMLVVGAFIYIKITSHDEMALIRTEITLPPFLSQALFWDLPFLWHFVWRTASTYMILSFGD